MSAVVARNLPQQRHSSWHQHSQAKDRPRHESPALPFLFPNPPPDLELELDIQRRDSMKAQRWLGLVTEVPRPREEEERPRSQRASLEWLEPEEAPESERALGVHPALRVEVSSPVSIGSSVSPLEPTSSRPDPLRPEPLRIPSKPHSRPISMASLEPQYTASPVSLSPEVVPKPWMRSERSGSISSQHLTLSPAPLSPESSSPWAQSQRRLSFDPQHLASSPEALSPDQIPKPWARPDTQRRVSYESQHPPPNSLSPDLLPKPRSRPQRPLSFASYRTEGRPTNKLASSRGFRINTCPNFSRPISGIAPKAVPGEEIEQDPLYQKFDDDEVGPPSPDSPRPAGLGFEVERIQSRDGFAMESGRCGNAMKEIEKEQKEQKEQGKKRPRKARWSSLPLSLMKFAKRKSTDGKEERKEAEKEQEEKDVRMDLTEENLQRWEYEVGYLPKMYRLELAVQHDPLLTPMHSPMQMEHQHSAMLPIPPPPRMSSLLTPPSSPNTALGTIIPSQKPPLPHHNATHPQHQHHKTSSSTSLPLSMLKELSLTPPQPSETHPKFRPASPAPPPSNPTRTCSICKESLPVPNFPVRRTTSSCDHQPGACLECLQNWITECMERRGWDRVSCPECGEGMGYEDVGALTGEREFDRYDTLATRATLSSLPNFHWCQNPSCTSGQIHHPTASSQPIFTCTSCRFTYCLNHPTTPYALHLPYTCTEYDTHIAKQPPSPSTSSSPSPRTAPLRPGSPRTIQVRKGRRETG